jgi:hypothetical protein
VKLTSAANIQEPFSSSSAPLREVFFLFLS